MRHKIIVDIKPPSRKQKRPKSKRIGPEARIFVTQAEPKKNYFKPAAAALVIITVAVAVFYTIGFLELKSTIAESAPELYQKFNDAKSALANLETKKATEYFGGINSEINSIKLRAEKYGLLQISELWGSVVPRLKTIPETFSNLANLTGAIFTISANLEELESNGVNWLTNQKGELVIKNLESTKGKLANVSDAITAFKNQETSLPYASAENFLNQSTQLLKAEDALAALIDWLKKPGDKHLLLLFQNPSELRPAGGFIGSYADLRLNANGLQDIKVWNIYDPDGQFTLKIIPPKQLQGITASWGARDSNWFFDFPTSAQKVISFLEKSKIYQEQGITFDGLAAINAAVVETVLKIVGDIELPEYKLTVTPENFLSQIQYEVETGRDNRSGEPKRILKILTPIIFQKLVILDDSQKRALLEKLKKHFDRKDIMLYSKDWKIQLFLEDAGVAGEVMALPANLEGDYLAVVNANIAGGKSDAVVAQKIKLSSKIEADGRIDNFLIIEKTHDGHKQKELWYKKTNRSYIKIFTPRGSRLTYIDGHAGRKIKPVLNYAQSSYLTDRELALIENTAKTIKEFDIQQLEESGKTVFAAWFNVPAGSTEKLELHYFNPVKLAFFENQIPYRFIFEKQSGATTSFELLIESPPGYIWKETGSPYFNYVTYDPLGREIINLTLVRDL